MAVPDFQTLMLPLLRFAGDAKVHSVREARSAMAREFKLTSDELAQMLPSGRAPMFPNRLAWAKQYLSAAGLLDTSKRAHFAITSVGADLLRNPPARIDIKFLERYPAFVAFRARSVKTSIGVVTIPEEENVSATESEIAAAPTVHTEIQATLLRLGAEMGYDVWVARNDISRTFGDKRFEQFPRMLLTLPVQFDEATKRTIELIDVLWLKGKAIVAAFEVESTTSIYSGLLRMADFFQQLHHINLLITLIRRQDFNFAKSRARTKDFLADGTLHEGWPCWCIARIHRAWKEWKIGFLQVKPSGAAIRIIVIKSS